MLAKRLKLAAVPSVVPVVKNRVADWCVHEFKFSRRRFLMLCNTASLYPIVVEARGVTGENELIQRSVQALGDALETGRYARNYARWIAPGVGSVQWAPIPDRSLLGGMNELIFQATWALAEGRPLDELPEWLAQTPLGTLGMNSPDRVFPTLKGGAEG